MNTIHTTNLSGIDANLVVLLDALLLHQSVSKAAGHVALSQSALSHALGRLRLHFGDELLTRAGREMVITPRGAELQPIVRSAVLAMERVFTPQSRFSPETLSQSFALILNDLLELTLLPEIDRRLCQEAPGANLQTLPAAMDAVTEMRRGRADAAVTVRAALPADFHRTLMMKGEYAIVMRRDHPLARGRLTTGKYVSAEHLLVSPLGDQGCCVIDDLLAEQGLGRRVARKVSSFWSALLLVSRSDYIASLPAAAVRAMNSFVDLKVMTPPFPLGGFDYDLVWHKRSEEDPAQRWFRHLVLDCAGHVTASGLS
jgi:DNA-binding transcriptional LysR family regulator